MTEHYQAVYACLEEYVRLFPHIAQCELPWEHASALGKLLVRVQRCLDANQ